MSTAVQTDASVTIRPEPARWLPAVSKASSDAPKRGFRASLGLDPARPVVMSGHQAGVWHPGILAKWLAMADAAARTGAQAVWLVVDSDTNDPSSIRYPVLDAGGALQAKTWAALPGLSVQGGRLTGHVPTGRVAARAPAPLPADSNHAAVPGVAEGLAAIHAALAAHARAPSVAAQLASACSDLIALRAGCVEPVKIVMASDLAKTDAFATIVRSFARDPHPAVAAYTSAIAAHPGASVSADDGVPLWEIGSAQSSPRKAVDAASIDPDHPERYAPRALLLTGLMRWLGCDAFIHGTGGAGPDGDSGYDAITVGWLRDWLGATLAPSAMVTATLRLDFRAAGRDPLPSPDEIRHAGWLAHAARHRPALLDDPAGQARREAALDTLRTLRYKRDPASRRLKLETYRALHAALRDSRGANAQRLAELQERARLAAARRVEAEILADRTWAFPLYTPQRLRALAEQVHRGLEG
ncbi:MAG: hypothetical protein K2Q20_14755 [Phycisphaerales bacterium]|nr:hypothetical protein [Phycisphaerales bacterium]